MAFFDSRIEPRLRLSISRRLNRRDDVDDIIQDVKITLVYDLAIDTIRFLKGLDLTADLLEQEVWRFTALCHSIARNMVCRQNRVGWRHAKRQRSIDSVDEAILVEPPPDPTRLEKFSMIDEFLPKLRPRQRAAFVLRYQAQEKLSYKDIAERLSVIEGTVVNEDAVRQLLARALESFRAEAERRGLRPAKTKQREAKP